MPKKSRIYAISTRHRRPELISHLLGFTVGFFPLIYISAPIFKGKSKVINLQAIGYKVKNKLANWKANLPYFV